MTCASCFPEHTNIRNNIAYEKRGHHQQHSNPPCGIIMRCAHINCSYDLLRIMFIVYLSINLIEFMLEKRKLHCLSILTINKRYESDSCLFLLMEILRNFFSSWINVNEKTIGFQPYNRTFLNEVFKQI